MLINYTINYFKVSMKVFEEQKILKKYIEQHKKDQKIGFVPTMGALHKGHESLILQSKKRCDITICSIFVNPTQFNDKTDYDNYPKNLDSDLAILKNLSCDIVYCPNKNDIYNKIEVSKKFQFNGINEILEGQYRPGHFDGVATIVEKLFNIIEPDYAFFGQKDLQQLYVIKQLVKNLNIKTQIIGCPTIRENNGVAKSSRNQLISKEDLEKSSIIFKQLQYCKNNFTKLSFEKLKKTVIQNIECLNFKIDYFEFIELETFTIQNKKIEGQQYAACIAVIVSGVRLIDNIIL